MPGSAIDRRENMSGSAGGTPSALSLFAFVLLFIASVQYLGNVLPDRVLAEIIDLTGVMVASFLQMMGFPALYMNSYLLVSGFTMTITLECTALHMLSIYGAGVLSYPFHRLSYKLAGLIAGSAAIIVLNVLRISALGIIGTRSLAVFHFAHTFLWQGTFVVLVLLIWYLWAKGTTMGTRRFLRIAAVFFFASIASLIGLGYIMDRYTAALAAAAEALLNLFPGTGVLITAAGSKILYANADARYQYEVSTDIANAAIFLALMIAAPGRDRIIGRVVKIAAGFAVLTVLYVIIVTTVGSLLFRLQATTMEKALWFIRGISLLLPALVWQAMRRSWSGWPLREQPGTDPAAQEHPPAPGTPVTL